MEITTTTVQTSPARRAAVTTLAVLGFIALIVVGILLALYSVSFFPGLSEKGGAAAFLSSLFRSADDNSNKLEVVTATTTLPIIEDEPVATSTVTSEPAKPATTGTPRTTTVVRRVTSTVAPYGDPDLSVTITAVGYLRRNGDTDTFVESNEIPRGKNGAVQFTVSNTGTNVTDNDWKFEVSVPSSPSQTFTSRTQPSLNPDDRIDYVLGFENGRKGDNREISVTVDSTDKIDESNERNNEDSQSIDIK